MADWKQLAELCDTQIAALDVEAVWRLLRWQPAYPPLHRLQAARDGRARRKAVVAVARHLAIDLWRLATGQTTADRLGLVMNA